MLAIAKQDLELQNTASHYTFLHANQIGNVILWEKVVDNKPNGLWAKLSPGDAHIPALLKAFDGKNDSYMTVNEFYNWRVVAQLKSLRACYVDIDGCTNLAIAEQVLLDACLPLPTHVVFSGRGMHLYWVHEPVPAKVLPVWQRCQDVLIKALSVVGADPAARDCTRVLRLVGSVNSKNGAEVRGLVLEPQPYGFHHLCDEILGYREPYKKERAEQKVVAFSAAKVRRTGYIPSAGIYKRWGLVYQDLLKIADYYFLGGVPDGYRDSWLFLSAVALSWFAEPAALESELVAQAKIWTPGLRTSEVKAAIKTPIERAKQAAAGVLFKWDGEDCDPRYRFRRETLYEKLKPIIKPDLACELRAIVSDETKAKHEQEREKARDRVAEGRRASHEVGRKVDESSDAQKKPWDALGISRATYYRQKKKGEL